MFSFSGVVLFRFVYFVVVVWCVNTIIRFDVGLWFWFVLGWSLF